MPTQVDVLICGSGSAGVCAAAWLARYGVRCKIVDSRAGPLEVGQADGVQCRTVEIFESFNMAEELLREAYHVLETTFWKGDAESGIARTGRTADTAPGLSHLPHVILNQARINGLLLEDMKRSNEQEVDYGCAVTGVEIDSARASDPEAYCVTAHVERNGEAEVITAKYALACDGAHSAVRRSLGFKMIGDSTDSVWGVMDVFPRTNFPDIRKKCAIQSSSAGSLLIVPREGGAMVRFYIQLPHGMKAKDVKINDLQDAARQIFLPYKMEIADTFWWSAYAIGQRLADHFTKDTRIFLTGDSCHTHSPKAGQGMNTSLQDGYNIGWKLALVLKKQAHPDLLKTYDLERSKVAADLIAFDREFAKAFSSSSKVPKAGEKTPEEFSQAFVKAGRYTAGLTAKYGDSIITSAARSTQSLAPKLEIGMRFPSAQVVRFCDAKAMQLVKAFPSDGRWRVVIFAGDIRKDATCERLKKLGDYLGSEQGPIRRFTSSDEDIDSFIEPIVVLSGARVEFEQEMVPDVFWPVTGKYKMRDVNKVFVDDESYNHGHGKAYEMYGIDPENGAVAIVRPDQYVSMILPLDDHTKLGEFFEGFATIKA